MWSKIKEFWNLLDGNKTKIAGFMALGVQAIQSVVMDEFNYNPVWWIHAVSIVGKVSVALGVVGVGHKFIKLLDKPTVPPPAVQ
jgi:hypothetical protein